MFTLIQHNTPQENNIIQMHLNIDDHTVGSAVKIDNLIKAMLGMLGGGENLCGWLFMMEL